MSGRWANKSRVAFLAACATCACHNTAATAVAPIVLGVLVPLEGQESGDATLIENGVSAAVHLINENGGILGHPVITVTADSNSFPADANLAIPAAQSLVDQGAVAILGIGEGSQLDALRIWGYANEVFLVSSEANETGRGPNPFGYTPTGPIYFTEFRAIALDMNNLGLKKIVNIVPSGALSPTFDIAATLSYMKAPYTINEVNYPVLSDYTSWDPTSTVNAALALSPDGILLWNLADVDGGLLVNGLLSQNYHNTLYLARHNGNLPPNVGAAAASGLREVVVAENAPSSPQQVAFAAAYAAWGHTAPDPANLYKISGAFDMTIWTLLAMERAGELGLAGGAALVETFPMVVDPNAQVVETTDMKTALSVAGHGSNIYWRGSLRDHRLDRFGNPRIDWNVNVCCDPNGSLPTRTTFSAAQTFFGE